MLAALFPSLVLYIGPKLRGESHYLNSADYRDDESCSRRSPNLAAHSNRSGNLKVKAQCPGHIPDQLNKILRGRHLYFVKPASWSHVPPGRGALLRVLGPQNGVHGWAESPRDLAEKQTLKPSPQPLLKQSFVVPCDSCACSSLRSTELERWFSYFGVSHSSRDSSSRKLWLSNVICSKSYAGIALSGGF